jgi:small-conductance mechanosensitive channel
MRALVWESSLFHRHSAKVPGLLIGMVDAFIFLIAILIILQFVYGQSITAIATLSGAAAVVLGFSAQSTLGEMFSGLALSISRPFKVGDWISVDGLDEGKVIDQTWRHVQIRTRDHSILNVANSLITGKSIKNYSSSHEKIRIFEVIHFNQSVDPAKIQDLLLSEIIKSNTVAADPAPTVLFKGISGDRFEFVISYFIENYELRPVVSDSLWKLIVDTVQKSGYGLSVLSK